MADGDDQSSGISFQHPAGLLLRNPTPTRINPIRKKIAAFQASHPESVRAAAKIIQSHGVSSGFDNSTFNGLNAFRFINADGVSTPVRWSMVPMGAFKPTATAQSRQELSLRRSHRADS
jgi:catalase